MGSAVYTANMEGRGWLILAALVLAISQTVNSNPRKIREAEDEVTTTMESVVEKTKVNESSDNDDKVGNVDEIEEHIDVDVVIEDEPDMDHEHDADHDHDHDNEVHDQDQENHIHDHDKNCHKCHKASFKYRKDLFCDKCVEKGLLDLKKVATKPVHCKKCRKSRFRAKNGDFCTMKCPNQMKDEVVEDETTTEAIIETTTTSDGFRLGPLGSLLKYFVVSNTWGSPQPLPQAEVEE